jgi:hypothetical protein
MLRFNHLGRNLRIFLLMAALCPLVCRQMVTVFIQTGVTSSPEGSVSRSVCRCYGQGLLRHLNCQLLESVRVNLEPKSENYVSHGFSKIQFASRTSVKKAPAVFNEKLCSSEGLIHLRI